ncbi:hypothetical protein FB451DRAFT_1180152 [Mycena latifolia]|nr:hypothetical protein FB451DRAFT_1180152 [Mycena latifolia]
MSESSPPALQPRSRPPRRNIVYSSPDGQQDELPPSDPPSDWELDLPGLDDIADSDDEDDQYLPALMQVPEDELTDDEDEADSDSDSEDELEGPRELNPGSSPLSAAPSATQTPVARNVSQAESSPLSAAPETPTPLAANSVLSSSPMYTPRTEKSFVTQRALQKRRETLNKLREVADMEKEAEAAATAKQRSEEVAKKKAYFDEVLGGLEAREYNLADLMEYVFDPSTRFESGYDWRWHGFFSHKPVVKRIFSYWTSSRAKTTRAFIWDWAYQLVRKVVAKESRRITLSGLLSKVNKTVNEEFFLNYSLRGMSATLRGLSPAAFGIFDAYSSTPRQRKAQSQAFLKKRDVVSKFFSGVYPALTCSKLSGSVAIALLNGASQNNSYAQAVCGTYLMATGAQRQHFGVLHGIGFSMGYSSIIGQGAKGGNSKDTTEAKRDTTETESDSDSNPFIDIDGVDPPVPGRNAKKNKKARKAKKEKKRRMRSPGTLWLLANACRATARAVAATGLFLIVYDNVNMMVRVAEQILGRKNTQENGTCATAVQLHDTKLEDLLAADLDKGIAEAAPLTVEDLQFTEAEAAFFHENMVHTILRIIVRYGGEGFQRWQDDLEKMQPTSTETISVHESSIHPLPAMEIDQNSTKMNIEVVEAINTELGLDVNDPNYIKYVKILAGDQRTIARQRSILQVRLGHESGAQAWRHIVLMPGLFHAKIADCHGVLHTHFGKPSAGFRSPGSLGFHNTVLDRLPITLTSLPPFRTCRDLIMVSLYARLLHCLLLVSKKQSLDEYAKDCDSWDTLVGHAEQIYAEFADADRVQELRELRLPEERRRAAELAAKAKSQKKSTASKTQSAAKKDPLPHIKKGDMVFENAILFIRDALLTREFADAIKAGDSGRIVLILKLFAFTYRGNGRTKYAHEMLHVLHNIVNVWSDGLRHAILHNWLLYPTGKKNAFVEVDLVQEHLNLWIKKIYKADGDAHSWDWLALVSPCVDILRRLATSMNKDLGSRQGNKHTIPNLDNDIHCLMASLTEHEVYICKEGRVLDDDEMPAPDVLSVGAATLTHGTTSNPLQDFNDLFDQLCRRRELIPVSALNQYLPGAAPAGPPGAAEAPVAPEASSTSTMSEVLASANIIPMNGDDFTVDDGMDIDMDLPDLVLPDATPPGSEDEAEDEDEDLFADSPTLTRLDEADVDLDMDDDWMLDEEFNSGSDYGSDDEANIQLSGSESD